MSNDSNSGGFAVKDAACSDIIAHMLSCIKRSLDKADHTQLVHWGDMC